MPQFFLIVSSSFKFAGKFAGDREGRTFGRMAHNPASPCTIPMAFDREMPVHLLESWQLSLLTQIIKKLTIRN
ncbi:hypothetical protein ACQ4M4_10630 [Leptolyngbya sp. AN02str]